ncbi:MAG: hypothetical protein C6H99_05965 [Epsilonproteobacteria bacterium]|nr:hypothetical protein [Campylobacterota bacterium]NPA64025.1 WD40 repeat domain-containing protein [Campylobacterota bacterium]
MKKILALILVALSLFGVDLKPIQEAKIEGAVLDMVLGDGKIFIATDASRVLVLDQNFSIQKEIKVRQIKDFMGELNNADIYSIDYVNGTILYLAQAEDGYSELFLYRDGKKINVLDKSKMMYAKAAKFVDEKRAVLALMSDEVVLYDLEAKKVLKKAKAGEYFYSVMSMDPDRKYIAIGDEGGEVVVIDPKTLQKVKAFKDINKDKILSIYINDNLVAAGSRADKTLALYDIISGATKVVKNPDFFIYVTGLSPDNALVVYGDNEKYILKVLDTNSLSLRYRLVGHKNIVNVVRFEDEKTIITGSETGEIKKWRLK